MHLKFVMRFVIFMTPFVIFWQMHILITTILDTQGCMPNLEEMKLIRSLLSSHCFLKKDSHEHMRVTRSTNVKIDCC
jgi:hypothetical protein